MIIEKASREHAEKVYMIVCPTFSHEPKSSNTELYIEEIARDIKYASTDRQSS